MDYYSPQRQTICVEIFNLTDGDEWEISFHAFLELLENKMSSVPKEFIDSVTVLAKKERDMGDMGECYDKIEITASYERPETDDEFHRRITLLAERKKSDELSSELRDRQEYARLKIKYG